MLSSSHSSVSLLALALLACVPACTTRHAILTPKPAPADAAIAPVINPIPFSRDGWQSETFPLPPGFAPDLPTGAESLRFAPGWRNADAEGFWSYAFVMWIDEPAPTAARIEVILEKYYTGLMVAFAGDKDISGTPAEVDVRQIGPNQYVATMHLIDAFATFKPIDIRVKVESIAEAEARSSLRIRVSPKGKDHVMWESLQAAIQDILTHTAADGKE